MPSTDLLIAFLVNLAGALSAFSMLFIPVAAVNKFTLKEVVTLYSCTAPLAILLAIAFCIP